MKKYLIGTYTRMGGPGVALIEADRDSASLLSSAWDMDNPTWVSKHEPSGLYIAAGYLKGGKDGDGGVAAYRLENDRLIHLKTLPVQGNCPCYITFSADGRTMFTANYLSGTVSVIRLDEGIPEKVVQVVRHAGSGPNEKRQEGAHCHQTVFRPGTVQLFVNDLGCDRIFVYDWDAENERLLTRDAIALPAGAGPRHLAFLSENVFFVTGELDNRVRRYEFDPAARVWRFREDRSTLPEGFADVSNTAAVRIRDNTLYVSNRGHDSVCAIGLKDGAFCGASRFIPSLGHGPRDFAFTEEGLLFANQGDGIATEEKPLLPLPGAVCICPV